MNVSSFLKKIKIKDQGTDLLLFFNKKILIIIVKDQEMRLV